MIYSDGRIGKNSLTGEATFSPVHFLNDASSGETHKKCDVHLSIGPLIIQIHAAPPAEAGGAWLN